MIGHTLFVAFSVAAHGQSRFMNHAAVPPPSNLIRPPNQLPCCRGYEAAGARTTAPSRSDPPTTIPYIVPLPVYVASPDSGNTDQGGGADPTDSSRSQDADMPGPAASQADLPPENTFFQSAPAGKPCSEGRATREDQSDHSRLFIVLNDRTVYTAMAYWVVGATLHYITPGGSHNQVSLQLVDRKLSSQFNAGRIGDLALSTE